MSPFHCLLFSDLNFCRCAVLGGKNDGNFQGSKAPYLVPEAVGRHVAKRRRLPLPAAPVPNAAVVLQVRF